MENEISPGVKVQVRVKDGAPTKQTLAPQGAAPLRGSGAERRRGLQSEEIADREKTVRSADHSFSDWQSHNPSDPSVSLSLDSSPKRGAKGVDENSPAPQGAAEVSGRVPSPRRALPLLGEVPSAHTGERGLRT